MSRPIASASVTDANAVTQYGRILPSIQFPRTNRSHDQLVERALFALANDRKRGEQQRLELEDEPDQPGHHEHYTQHARVVENNRPQIDSRSTGRRHQT